MPAIMRFANTTDENGNETLDFQLYDEDNPNLQGEDLAEVYKGTAVGQSIGEIGEALQMMAMAKQVASKVEAQSGKEEQVPDPETPTMQ